MMSPCASGILAMLGYRTGVDYMCRQDDSRRGIYISEWRHADPQPTEEQVNAHEAAYLAMLNSFEYRLGKIKIPNEIRVCRALLLRMHSNFANLSPGRKAKIKEIIDAAGDHLLQLLPKEGGS